MTLVSVRLWRIEGYVSSPRTPSRLDNHRTVFLAQGRFPSTEDASVALLHDWSDRPCAAGVESIGPADPPRGVNPNVFRILIGDG